MLKKGLVVLLFAILASLPLATKAEEITSFDVTAKIQPDSSVQISEKIQYDFGSIPKHGIFRSIPYTYDSVFRSLPLHISNVSVLDEKGQLLPVNISKKGLDLVIKIGDPDKTITGAHTYIINYTVENAINFLEDNDQFYWNITGNEWKVAIRKASATIFLPPQTDLGKISLFCYAGGTGSNNDCQESRVGSPIFVKQTNLRFEEGLTVRLVLPKEIVYKPSWAYMLLNFLQDNLILLLPLVIFLILLCAWRIFGKDQKGAGVVIAQFDPPDNLTPAELGAIFDQKVNNKDISAEIISLATRGYIKINFVEKQGWRAWGDDYEFVQLQPALGLDNQHDKLVLAALFGEQSETSIRTQGVLLSSFKKNKSVYKKIRASKKVIYKDLVTKGYYKSNPNTVREVCATAGFVVIYLVLKLSSDPVLSVALIISSLIVVLFSFIMPALTKKGALAKEHILGLKKYLQVAEKARLDFHNAPEKKPEHFEKLLPFAMALGVEKQWAKQFESMHLAPPAWYGGSSASNFSAVAFVSSLGGFSSSLKSAGVSSGGGGSSGGGRGGGGGGSW